MSDSQSVENLESEFIKAVRCFWLALQEGHKARAANKYSDKVDKIVEEWQQKGLASTRLRTLLNYSDVAVRYAAAASLLKLGEADVAVPVLEELSKDPKGLIAPTAKPLLRKYKIGLSNN